MKKASESINTYKVVVYALLLSVGVALGTIASGVLAQDGGSGEPVVQEELARAQVDAPDGPKTVWVRRVELAPDVAMAPEPEIEHPAEEFVYVLQGTAALTRQGETAVEFTAGEAWHNDFEQPHTLENASPTDPLAVIAVWIGDEGAF